MCFLKKDPCLRYNVFKMKYFDDEGFSWSGKMLTVVFMKEAQSVVLERISLNIETNRYNMFSKNGLPLRTIQCTQQRIPGKLLKDCFFDVQRSDRKTKHRYSSNCFWKNNSNFWNGAPLTQWRSNFRILEDCQKVQNFSKFSKTWNISHLFPSSWKRRLFNKQKHPLVIQ